MKKTIKRIAIFLMIITLTFTTTSCGQISSGYCGTYTSSTGGSIVVHKHTVDLNSVALVFYFPITSEYKETREYKINATGLFIHSEKICDGCYKITGQVSIYGPYNVLFYDTDITAYLYDNDGSPYIEMYGHYYYK